MNGWTHDTGGQLGADILTQAIHPKHEVAACLRTSIPNYGENGDTLKKITSKPGTNPDNHAGYMAILHGLAPPRDKQHQQEDMEDF
jgi:hypothetical protein